MRNFQGCEGVCFCSTFDAGSVATYTLSGSDSTTTTTVRTLGVGHYF
jgi:hypothetical protein